MPSDEASTTSLRLFHSLINLTVKIVFLRFIQFKDSSLIHPVTPSYSPMVHLWNMLPPFFIQLSNLISSSSPPLICLTKVYSLFYSINESFYGLSFIFGAPLTFSQLLDVIQVLKCLDVDRIRPDRTETITSPCCHYNAYIAPSCCDLTLLVYFNHESYLICWPVLSSSRFQHYCFADFSSVEYTSLPTLLTCPSIFPRHCYCLPRLRMPLGSFILLLCLSWWMFRTFLDSVYLQM